MDLPNLEGKTFVVTGANTGIGRVTAVELARAGADVWLACRSEARTAPVLDEIREVTGREARFIALDLGDLASVRTCAKALLENGTPIHGLVNNAGLAGQKGLTQDGFELLFGVNHLGHFLLTHLLLDRLKDSAPARIVNVASRAHFKCEALDWESLRAPTRTVTTMKEYAASKLANILFTRELAKRLEGTGVTAYAVHPGVVASDIWRKIPWPIRPLMKRRMISNEAGARTTIHCATAPELAEVSGGYYDDCAERAPSKVAEDDDLARALWDRSVAWVGLDAPGAPATGWSDGARLCYPPRHDDARND
jgi:retinol dehydrogenase 12